MSAGKRGTLCEGGWKPREFEQKLQPLLVYRKLTILSAVSPSLTLFHSQLTKVAQLRSVGSEDTEWPLCRADMAMSTGGSYRRVRYVQNVRAMSLLLDDLQYLYLSLVKLSLWMMFPQRTLS